MLDFLNGRAEVRRKAGKIYGAIVTAARRPDFYAALGVPDTPSGRYEMVVLHLFLVLERLRALPDEGAALPRLLVEAFVADMDDSLRELATGDLAVPKKVRRAAVGLYERTMDYRGALQAGDEATLAKVLSARIFAGSGGDGGSRALARYALAASAALSRADAVEALAAQHGFPPLEGVAGDAA